MKSSSLGLSIALALSANLFGCSGATPVVDAGTDAGTPGTDGGPRDAGDFCAVDDDCVDTRYCNGSERCAPDDPSSDRRGCLHENPPCMPTQQCIEEESRCVTQCAIEPDADGDGVNAIVCGGTDCDDADPGTFPLSPEVCDDDAHDEDCDPTTYGHRDEDRDQMDDAACCNVTPTGERICGADCSDQRPDIRLGFAEVCDGFDNDCDGTIDERVARSGGLDADFDLHGAAAVDPPLPAAMFCAGEPGFSSVLDDCSDDNPAAHRAQVEICDTTDNNCNGEADESQGLAAWYPDDDGDGFGGTSDISRIRVSCTALAGYVLRAGDCADDDVSRSPAQSERCNAIDDDCDGRADYLIGPGDTEDDDGDGHADRRCGGGDCNDADPTIYPDAVELDDDRDNDCDGMIDDAPGSARWYRDADLDGYGDALDPGIESSTFVPGRITRAGDCDDGVGSIHPGAADFCDGVDDNCDGVLDDGAMVAAFFADVDRDGWGGTDLASIVIACAAPLAAAARLGDCRDSEATVYPGATEFCDLADQDCDTRIDEDADSLWYVDDDGDGAGTGTAIESCTPITGRVTLGGDCDDANPLRAPGLFETCNGGDEDCDAVIDEMAAASCTGPFIASAMCVAGVCVPTCVTGHSDCDGLLETGCEIDTAHSSGHCGACFAECALADTCARSGPSGTCDDASVVELGAGAQTMFARRATGGVAVWGDAELGVASLGAGVPQHVPVLAGIGGIAEMALSVAGGCARSQVGEVFCWGSGSHQPLTHVRAIALPRPARSIGASSDHACAVLDDRSVYCWGHQLRGRLGDGAGADVLVAPTPVLESGVAVDDAVAVTCGADHTCVMREQGDGARYVSCFGGNGSGQLGLGFVSGTHLDARQDVLGLPTDLVAFARGSTYATCVRNVPGRVYCWGDNYTAVNLGLGAAGAHPQLTPATPIGLEAGVLDIVLMTFASFSGGGCAIRGGVGGVRELLCWGNDAGLGTASFLGDGVSHSTPIYVPTPVGPAGSTVLDALTVARGQDAMCVARASGVWCAGRDVEGVFGNGTAIGPPNTLVQVTGFP